MSEKAEPPATVITDLQVAHLTRAVTRKGEIRFELHVPENDPLPAEALIQAFYHAMPFVPAKDGPISVDEVEGDKSKLLVVYKPHGKRKAAEDMRAILGVFEEMEIPVTATVTQGVQRAFRALKDLNAPAPGSAAEAEVERRTGRQGPGGRGSR